MIGNDIKSFNPQTIYKRLFECLEVVKLSDKKLSSAMRERLEYTIQFLKLYTELQGFDTTDITAIGFRYEEELSEDEEEEIDPTEYGKKPKK